MEKGGGLATILVNAMVNGEKGHFVAARHLHSSKLNQSFPLTMSFSNPTQPNTLASCGWAFFKLTPDYDVMV